MAQLNDVNLGGSDLGGSDLGNTQAEVPQGAIVTHTIDEIPELDGLQSGDSVSFKVKNVSSDGKSYDLEYIPLNQAEVPQTGQTAGREAIAQSLTPQQF